MQSLVELIPSHLRRVDLRWPNRISRHDRIRDWIPNNVHDVPVANASVEPQGKAAVIKDRWLFDVNGLFFVVHCLSYPAAKKTKGTLLFPTYLQILYVNLGKKTQQTDLFQTCVSPSTALFCTKHEGLFKEWWIRCHRFFVDIFCPEQSCKRHKTFPVILSSHTSIERERKVLYA